MDFWKDLFCDTPPLGVPARVRLHLSYKLLKVKHLNLLKLSPSEMFSGNFRSDLHLSLFCRLNCSYFLFAIKDQRSLPRFDYLIKSVNCSKKHIGSAMHSTRSSWPRNDEYYAFRRRNTSFKPPSFGVSHVLCQVSAFLILPSRNFSAFPVDDKAIECKLFRFSKSY